MKHEPTTLYGVNDAIEGVRVVCMCREIHCHDIKKPRVINKTHTHRGCRVTLKGGVRCVIEKSSTLQSPPET